jgi:putative nucleotidyltransferase with HDIG domain
VLLAAEQRLFERLAIADQRHALLVLRRFDELMPAASVVARRAALLHDVGKTVTGLGTLARVMATIVGPRTDRFRQYVEHERIGAELLTHAGSDPVTVALVRGDGEPTTVNALHKADDI